MPHYLIIFLSKKNKVKNIHFKKDNYFPKNGTFLPRHGKAQPNRSKAIYPTGDQAYGHHVLGALKYRKPIPATGPERWKGTVFTCPVNPVGMTIFVQGSVAAHHLPRSLRPGCYA